jgi:hypothetical protein
VKAGDTFYSQAPTSNKPYLYVVLTDPSSDDHVVIANVTSQGPSKDQSCILATGDHPGIFKDSIVNYADALIASIPAISDGAKGGVVQYSTPVNPSVLAKIRAGAIASPNAEAAIKTAVQLSLK